SPVSSRQPKSSPWKLAAVSCASAPARSSPSLHLNRSRAVRLMTSPSSFSSGGELVKRTTKTAFYLLLLLPIAKRGSRLVTAWRRSPLTLLRAEFPTPCCLLASVISNPPPGLPPP